jgi:hypothetical protein
VNTWAASFDVELPPGKTVEARLGRATSTLTAGYISHEVTTFNPLFLLA